MNWRSLSVVCIVSYRLHSRRDLDLKGTLKRILRRTFDITYIFICCRNRLENIYDHISLTLLTKNMDWDYLRRCNVIIQFYVGRLTIHTLFLCTPFVFLMLKSFIGFFSDPYSMSTLLTTSYLLWSQWSIDLFL